MIFQTLNLRFLWAKSKRVSVGTFPLPYMNVYAVFITVTKGVLGFKKNDNFDSRKDKKDYLKFILS